MPATGLDLFLADVERGAADERRAEQARSTLAATNFTNTAIPQALVLVVQVLTCECCGSVTRAPNPNTLVRYDHHGHANSVQYRQRELERFLALPREVKEHSLLVPFCEGCFNVLP